MWPKINTMHLLAFSLIIVVRCLNSVHCEKLTTDDYVVSAQSECFSSKRIFSCFRYKAARYVWSMATGRMNLFDNDINQRAQFLDGNFSVVQLSEPSTEVIFPDARDISG